MSLSAQIDGHTVRFGDFVNVCVDGKWLLCKFLEASESGNWFECACEGDCVRGDDVFPDYYAEVDEVRFAYHKDDPSPHIGSGI